MTSSILPNVSIRRCKDASDLNVSPGMQFSSVLCEMESPSELPTTTVLTREASLMLELINDSHLEVTGNRNERPRFFTIR